MTRSQFAACCVPACGRPADPVECVGEPALCALHWREVSQATRARSVQTARRLQWLRMRWEDAAYFDAVERSGRYLKFSSALAQAADAAHLADQRVRTEASVAALRSLLDGPDQAPQLEPARPESRELRS